ncbi:alpha/beta hydrolase [Ruficoccus sp. ZRK36]|uniref:alpha/beta hydrolase n=1 Tax=Ruficoccus sp. ZRK36 TaxID=2866311 RepID=UPI001C72FAC6|nr:alpha/beta hydrolase [Ruficoccus sp. ZRK36]QYY36666.1 alpha/beta hydrolase [Ruficoccus sp. ZRK36]
MNTRSLSLFRRSLFLLALFCLPIAAQAAKPIPGHMAVEGELYISEEAAAQADDYQLEMCRLDLYVPDDVKDFPTVIWLHGGGLTGGKRCIPRDLKDKGLGVVGVEYRLSPQADLPAFLEDAAAATAWVLDNIAKYGGDPNKVFISGHSAGGYLAAMVGMDPRWLAQYGHQPNDLAGVIPCSGQMSTHFTVKKLRGDTEPQWRIVVDEYAPFTHASKDLPPICLILGDRYLDYPNRTVENDLLATSLRNLGHPHVEFYELKGLNHGSMARAQFVIIPEFIERVLNGDPPPKGQI